MIQFKTRATIARHNGHSIRHSTTDYQNTRHALLRQLASITEELKDEGIAKVSGLSVVVMPV